MAENRYYRLKEGFTKVIKKDIYNGTTVYLREDIVNGIEKPYSFNMVGNYRIGIRETPFKKGSDLYKWVYCADLCKKIV